MRRSHLCLVAATIAVTIVGRRRLIKANTTRSSRRVEYDPYAQPIYDLYPAQIIADPKSFDSSSS